MTRIEQGDEWVCRIEELRPKIRPDGLSNDDVNVELPHDLMERACKALAEFDEVQEILRKHYDDYRDAQQKYEEAADRLGQYAARGVIGAGRTQRCTKDPVTGKITTEWLNP